mgnify:CR=1 FL=1
MIFRKIYTAIVAIFRYAKWHISESLSYALANSRRGAIDDFGINFSKKVLRKFYESAITPAVVNRNYEGVIKSFGDRIRILSILHDVQLNDYTAGTDMSVQVLFDTSEELVINQQKAYDFGIDKVEELFTYGSDLAEVLVENAAKELQKTVDTFTLAQLAGGVAAGNWLGQNLRVAGGADTTQASIATSATGGTITVQTATDNELANTTIEAPDGTLFFGGFTTNDLGKPVRLTSGATWATEWYRITAVSNSNSVDVVNWDDAVAGAPIPNGDILRGLYGGSDFTADGNGDGKPTTQLLWGWEYQAAIPTTVTSSNIYEHLTLAAMMLDKGFVPQEDRKVILPFEGRPMLLQATELQPSGIEMLYTDTIVNGKVAKVSGFDVLVTAQGRFSTKVGHALSAGQGATVVVSAGTTGYHLPAIHAPSFLSFAEKWSESRTVMAERQFAKLYQGLFLYGAKVPISRRKSGVTIYAQAV